MMVKLALHGRRSADKYNHDWAKPTHRFGTVGRQFRMRSRSRRARRAGRRNRTKAVRAGVAPSREKPQKPGSSPGQRAPRPTPRRKERTTSQARAFELRQGRPRLLAFHRRMERRQNPLRNRPINPSAKLVEARLTQGFRAEPKDFLSNPPMRHDALQIRMRQTESSTSSHGKHPQAPAHRSRFA